MTTEQIYGRRAVREALRGPREVLELWVSERALKAEPWLNEPGPGARHRVMAERELTELAGTRDHQGVVAAVEPYRYADGYELAAVENPLLVCLDQVTDPHNLGAVIRSAEGAGATGVIVPAHGSARVTAAVCRASAGAVEHMPLAVVPNLARFLGDVKGADLWVYGAAGERDADVVDRPERRCGLRLRRRGARPAPARAQDVRRSRLDPARGQGRVAERQRRRGRPALRGQEATKCLTRPSTSSTGSTSCTPSGFEDPRELTDKLASFVAERGARGVLVFDGSGEDLSYGPLEVRFAEHADTLLERLAAENRNLERVCLVSSDSAVRGTSGQEVAKLSSATFVKDFSLEQHTGESPMRLEDKLDPKTRERLEKLRRGQGP